VLHALPATGHPLQGSDIVFLDGQSLAITTTAQSEFSARRPGLGKRLDLQREAGGLP
jgi:hypothetical protein